MSANNRVWIFDTTLRDGEQTPGVVMSVEDKIEIAQKLDEVGVDRIEAGMPAVSPQDFEAIKKISKLGLKSKIYTFARAINADIDKAIECGCHGVIVEVPIGYPKLKYQFKWTWEDVLRKSVDVINYAKKQGMHVVYFPYDTTRAREEDLRNLLTRIMLDAPPDAVGVVDTMGCILPEAMKYMVRMVKGITNLPVEAHTHNDFGMAVATELAAVEAGAEVVHSCANGLGERTGNAALEELIVALHVLYGYETHYKLDKLPELGKYNAGQKLVFWGMSLLILALITSGIVIWDQYFGHAFSIDQKRAAVLVHAAAAVGAITIWIVHVYAAIWVRGTIRAMTVGSVTAGCASTEGVLLGTVETGSAEDVEAGCVTTTAGDGVAASCGLRQKSIVETRWTQPTVQ